MLIQNGHYLTLAETENGHLRLDLTADGRTELQDRFAKADDAELLFACNSIMVLHDLFEDIRCNSWHEIISPEEIGALTDAPIIALNVERDEDGKFQNAEKVFWFEQYQIQSELKNLLKDGFVIFQNAEAS